MALSDEFLRFYDTWMDKAAEYGTEELRDCFDKFFTLFVVYNRLYAEVTFTLVRKGRIPRIERDISNPRTMRRTFPDRMAATYYLHQYLGSIDIINHPESDNATVNAINTICNLLENQRFYIKIDAFTGARQRQEDERLLRNLQSTNRGSRASAVLDLVYSIRCNMFHGHKSFQGIQIELLQPVITIIERLIKLIYQKLSNEQD